MDGEEFRLAAFSFDDGIGVANVAAVCCFKVARFQPVIQLHDVQHSDAVGVEWCARDVEFLGQHRQSESVDAETC